jgi:NADH-dependent peroxiredoxin subunit F
MEINNYELIIIGGGPAGAAAAVYAARKQLRTLLILKEWGGQSIVSDDIQNWIGTPHISGADLATSLQKHVEEYSGEFLTVHTGAYVTSLAKTENTEATWSVTCDDGKVFSSEAVLIATGSARRKLGIPGSDTFEHKGVTYCASCDGPMYGGADVVVVGGGNAGFESAAQLLAYCNSVTLLNRSETFRADAITIEKLRTNPKMTIITNAVPKEVTGGMFVEALTYTDAITGLDTTLATTGIFVEIGQIPATGFATDIVELTAIGQVIIDPRTQKTSTPGIWAAGDCTDVLYHQNNIAAGDAVRALEDIYLYLRA